MDDNRDVLVAIANNLGVVAMAQRAMLDEVHMIRTCLEQRYGDGEYEKPYAHEVNDWDAYQDDGGTRLVDRELAFKAPMFIGE